MNRPDKPVWMAAIADLYPRILENQATLIKKGAQKTPRPSEVPNGDPPPEIRTNWKILQDGNVRLSGRIPSAAGNNGRSLSEKPAWAPASLTRAKQSGGGRTALGAGSPVSAGISRPCERGGFSDTPLLGLSLRGTTFFGHHGAMRGTVARSCLTFCRIRGMGRGKRRTPLIPPTEPRRLYSPRCRIQSLRTVPLELGIECRRKQIHVKGTERSENSGHDLGVEGPLRGGNAAAGQEVRNKLVLPGAVRGDRDNIPAPAPCPQLFRRVERVPPYLFM